MTRFSLCAIALFTVTACQWLSKPAPPSPAVDSNDAPMVTAIAVDTATAGPKPVPTEKNPVEPPKEHRVPAEQPGFDPMREPVEAVGTAPKSEAEAVAAFERDCAVTFTAAFAEEIGPRFALGDECTSTDMEQMCDPDIFGCFRVKQRCRSACGTACTSCQGTCTSSCSDCRASCANRADAAACIHQCAITRAHCRSSCLKDREKVCLEKCSTDSETCWKGGDERRKKACPDCDALRTCMMKGKPRHGEILPGVAEKCLAQFPKNPAECTEWCSDP